MSASNPARPSGGYNHIQTDFLSPKTPNEPIAILDEHGGDEYLHFDGATKSIKIDTINERTADTGVTLDGTLLKDGNVRLASQKKLQAKNAANDAVLDILGLNASNILSFNPAVLLPQQWSPNVSVDAGGSLSPSSLYSKYVELGKICFFMIEGFWTISGTPPTNFYFNTPHVMASNCSGKINVFGSSRLPGYFERTTSQQIKVGRDDGAVFSAGTFRGFSALGFYEIA